MRLIGGFAWAESAETGALIGHGAAVEADAIGIESTFGAARRGRAGTAKIASDRRSEVSIETKVNGSIGYGVSDSSGSIEWGRHIRVWIESRTIE